MRRSTRMKCRLSQLNKLFFPEMITRISGTGNKVYLTFDDGPTPEITSQVLAFLLQYNAKATFFCRGDNAEGNPNLLRSIVNGGHVLGNHTYSHLHGWYTNSEEYTSDCNRAHEILNTPLFRPPYGKIRLSQYRKLRNSYTLYLWTALSWDFHPWISKERCLKISLRNLHPGSIIVFHDNQKSARNLLYVLPKILEFGSRKGYQFASLPLSV